MTSGGSERGSDVRKEKDHCSSCFSSKSFFLCLNSVEMLDKCFILYTFIILEVVLWLTWCIVRSFEDF